MKTRKFCPHCGRLLIRSNISGYAFQCRVCDEDFYRFEVLTTRKISLVRKLRRIERKYERSSKKEMRKRSFTK